MERKEAQVPVQHARGLPGRGRACPFRCFLRREEPALGGAAALQIKGSDTMVNLGQAWAEAFNTLHPEINVAVTGGGSGTGIAAILNGTCDIAESSRDLEEKEIQQAETAGMVVHETIVARRPSWSFIPQTCPALTMDQLREIFMGNVKRWSAFGGENRPIVLLSREVNS